MKGSGVMWVMNHKANFLCCQGGGEREWCYVFDLLIFQVLTCIGSCRRELQLVALMLCLD